MPVSGGVEVYRERVYCYELYHQMRCRWPKGSQWVINGEVDKRNHPYFKDCAPKPDFLVHVPGVDRNYAVIEVKSCCGAPQERIRRDRIRRDIDKLIQFTQSIEARYDRGIYLIFGMNAQKVLENVWEVLGGYEQEESAKVEVWTHSCVGKQAVPLGSPESESGLLG